MAPESGRTLNRWYLKDRWHLTEDQLAHTKAVAMVISAPVFARDRPSDVIAVLSVDSARPPDASYCATIREILEGMSARVTQRLQETGPEFPA
jgi:hypothetical protein